jgi:hypothetical protein
MRRRPLHPLLSTSPPPTTRLSYNPPPTVNARPRRTREQRRKEPLWAVGWTVQRIVVLFMLV